MNIQALIGLVLIGVGIAGTTLYGFKRGVFQGWWGIYRSWDWYKRIAMILIALGCAAFLTFGLH